MQIQKMSVSDAVMRMDLSGQAALLFRNAKNNQLNMVYRRPDGNILRSNRRKAGYRKPQLQNSSSFSKEKI